MRTMSFRLSLFVLLAALCAAQTPMTNETVIKMVKAGL